MKNIANFKDGDYFVAELRKSVRSVTPLGVERSGMVFGPFTVTSKKPAFLVCKSAGRKFRGIDWTFTKV